MFSLKKIFNKFKETEKNPAINKILPPSYTSLPVFSDKAVFH